MKRKPSLIVKFIAIFIWEFIAIGKAPAQYLQ